MFTIAIVNEKGGTGKTTTAVNLAAGLGERGLRVLLVDLDGQAASSRWLGVEDDTRFADALWRGSGLEPLTEVMPGVALAPGHGKLDAVAHDLRPTQGGQLRKLLGEVQGFDYIVIDCPPSLGNRLIGNALLAATHAIVPVETSILALDGLKILLTTLEDVREGFGHNIILAGVLACRFDSRTKLSHLVLGELKRALPGKVFNTVIRENVRMRECPASGKSILAYAPDCHAAADYRALAAEVVAVLGAAGAATDEQAGATAGEPTAAVADSWKEIGQLLSHAARKLGAAAPAEEVQPAQPQPIADTRPAEGPEGEQLPRDLEQVSQKAEPEPADVAGRTPAFVDPAAAPAQSEQAGSAAPAEQPQQPMAAEGPISAAPSSAEQPPAEVLQAAPVEGAVTAPRLQPWNIPITVTVGPMLEVGPLGEIPSILSEQGGTGAMEQRFPALEAMLRRKTVRSDRVILAAASEDRKRSSWLRILERMGGGR
jgi:chromosome partitioning protein